MTNMTVNESDARWGETREADRAARRRKRRTLLLTAWAAILFFSAMLSGFGGDPGLPGPRPLSHVAVILIFLVGGLVIWRNWRETDEMQRRLAIETWAMVGLTNFMLVPVLNILGELTGHIGWGSHAWKASLAISMAYYLIRRVRS